MEGMIKVEEQSTFYRLSEQILKESLSPIDSEQYIPTPQRRTIRRQLIREKEKQQNFNLSLWKMEENVAYMEFLIANYSLFMQSHVNRRLMKINVLMSKAIRTRSPDQCRSHHQKMMKYHRDIPNIIEYIKTLKMSEANSNTGQDVIQVKIEHQQENYDS